MTVEVASTSSRPQPVTMRLFVEIAAVIKAFFRGSDPAPVGRGTENAAVATEAVATAQIPTSSEIAADISPVADNEINQQEIERRRNLVRALFNDFWSGEEQKPASFTSRLDQAEDYLNERLAANGEMWRLDAKTRAMLSLPPRSNSAP